MNAFIQSLYKSFLGGKPGHGKAHELLHTHYVAGGVDVGGGDEDK